MARPLRIEFAGALYHVMSRGNERRPIVRDDRDRTRRLEWLGRTVETYGWVLHAFCLMDNHDHLFVETPEPNLAAGMQHLNSSYTSSFNRRHRRSGHLFQGRYKAHLIESEGHFWEVSRYIHLNPVRAGLVGRPEQWPWSSYAGYQRTARQLPWVTYRRVLREFGRNLQQARREYRRFVIAGIESAPASPWRDAAAGLILGSEQFVERIRGLLVGHEEDHSLAELESLRPRPPLERIVQVVAAAFDVDAAEWGPGRRHDDQARAAAVWLARRRFGYSAGKVAEAVGYTSHGGVPAAVRRVEQAGPTLRRRVERLGRELAND